MQIIEPNPWDIVPCLKCGYDIAYLSGSRHYISVLDTCMCDRGDEQPAGVVDRLAKIAEEA